MFLCLSLFRFHPCLALIIADTPEANDVCGIYNGPRASHPCRVCKFEFGKHGEKFSGRDPHECILLAKEGANDLLTASFGVDVEGLVGIHFLKYL